MSLYNFHFTDGICVFTVSHDVELSGITAIRQYAANHIRELRDAVPPGKLENWSHWKIIAVNQSGEKMFEVGFDFRPVPSR